MAVQRLSVWDEVDEFLISTPTPEQILAFRPSNASQQRLSVLLEANRNGEILPAEQAELNEHMALENFMRRLKVKALAKVAP
ncbi:MAG: hypothetical protein LCI00_18995 [Chloroflexi bacterium]|nr:hypothetical protein [Chloroflexota bacterium]